MFCTMWRKHLSHYIALISRNIKIPPYILFLFKDKEISFVCLLYFLWGLTGTRLPFILLSHYVNLIKLNHPLLPHFHSHIPRVLPYTFTTFYFRRRKLWRSFNSDASYNFIVSQKSLLLASLHLGSAMKWRCLCFYARNFPRISF